MPPGSVVATQSAPNANFPQSAQFPGAAGAPAPAALSEVEGLLMSLQANIEQALPIISALANVQQPGTAVSGATVNRVPGAAAAPGVANRTPTSGVTPALTPTGVPNPQTSYGAVGTNVFGMNANTRQLLFLLQTELARALPALRQLNGSTVQDVGGVSTVVPRSFVSRFVLVTNTPNQRILTPTGR
jgi:hypothetical protein